MLPVVAVAFGGLLLFSCLSLPASHGLPSLTRLSHGAKSFGDKSGDVMLSRVAVSERLVEVELRQFKTA
jgi:hypothetical protein